MTGMHGWGVSTPSAADVAAATCGLAMLVHIPNGMMFFIGTLSMIVAAGRLLAFTSFSGVITRLAGATPNEHMSGAPFTTSWPIAHLR
jgi:Na+/H+ antiporter NhaA